MTSAVASGTTIRVSRIERLSDLESLGDEWRQLESLCPDLRVFSTWEWCGAVVHHFPNQEPLWVFAARDGGDLVGLAPFGRRLEDGLRILRLIGTGLGPYSVADYQDLLLSDGFEKPTIDSFCAALQELSDGWDVLHLQEVPDSSRTLAPLVESARARGWRCVQRPGSDVHPLTLSESWEAYCTRLSLKTRRQVERRLRKLVRERGGEFVYVQDERALEGAMNTLYALHTRRWSAIGKPGIFRTEQRRRFHQEVARRFHQRGILNLSLLKADSQVVGASYAFVWNGTDYLYTSGFCPEPEWSPYGLGTTMDVHEIRTSMARGLRCVDFLRGDPHYKEHYRAESRYNRELLVFRDALTQIRYQTARFARRTAGRLRPLVCLRNRLRSPGIGMEDRP
jgi:CelD/BcsL family acetyltransferase involved in cellulose biosynthesis